MTLTHLFNPGSLAIVGASDEASKYGNWLATRAVQGLRPTYLVNARRATVLGRRAAPSLVALGEQVDLAVLAVPAALFEDAVDDALEAGVRVIVGITAGLGELGPKHRTRQQLLVDRVRSSGARLLGPNCLGVLDHSTGLQASINEFPRGHVALISQSGNVALDIAARLSADTMGVSRFVSVGNQADIDVTELVDSCGVHAETHAIAVYCEGFPDGRAFARAALRAVEGGKPVVLLTVGGSAASQRGAATHTGALVTSQDVVRAACRAAGCELVSSPAELVTLLQGLTRTRTPAGRRMAVLADGGGHASLAADALIACGLTVDPLPKSLREQVSATLASAALVQNPIDIAGAGEKDIDCFGRASRLLGNHPDVDAVILSGCFGSYRDYSAELGAGELRVAEEIASWVRGSGVTFVAHLVDAASPAARRLRQHGVAVYRDVEAVAWVLDRLASQASVAPTGVPQAPEPAPVARECGYWAAHQLLSAAGVPFPPGAAVASLSQLMRASRELQYPLVLKALGDAHKSEHRGVVLDIGSADALRLAWQELQARLAPDTCSVEEMLDLTDAVELIVGVRLDPAFGSVVLVGLGGTHTELLRDTQCALGPVTRAKALDMMNGLRGAPLLHGYRGSEEVDVDAGAALISDLSQLAAAHPEVVELECNPIALRPTGATALDARLVLR